MPLCSYIRNEFNNFEFRKNCKNEKEIVVINNKTNNDDVIVNTKLSRFI